MENCNSIIGLFIKVYFKYILTTIFTGVWCMLAKNIDLRNKTVLVTGAAGFIGANLVLELFKQVKGIKIIGLDSMNEYYDVRL